MQYYEYRVRTDQDLDRWRANLAAAFPQADWEVRTFRERSRRLGEVLDQVGSALLLIGFSALFIGGLGVSNSVHTYLQSKLATLRALGMREGRVARLYLGQVLLLAGLASLAGAILGGGLTLAGATLAAERLLLAPTLLALGTPLAVAMLFGLLTALTFTLPALGRALAVTPADLFRGIDASPVPTPPRYRWLTLASGLLTAGLMVVALPQPLFGLGFLGVVLVLLALLEGVVRLLRRSALHVSMPSWELFDHQDQAYQDSVIPPEVIARVVVEKASTMGWRRYTGLRGHIIGMHTFGASAPLKELQNKFGFMPEKIVAAAREQVGRGE